MIKDSDWKIIVEEHKNKLYGMSFRMLCDKPEAEDCVAEAFMKTYLHQAKIISEENVKGFLFTTCYRLCLSHIRKKKHLQNYLDLQTYDVMQIEENTEENINLLSKVEKLPEKFQQVIIMRYFQGLQTNEVAKTLFIPEDTVKTRLHRAIKRLQKMYQEDTILV
jgi:RNA polymerase sigma-70 factor, ECF subfamily